MQQASDVELAAVRPHQTRVQRVGMYVFGALFFGLLPMALVIPFGPPPGHPVYLVAWALGAVLSTAVMHRIIDRMMENCHLSLTARHLTLGRKTPRTIPIDDIVDTVPIFSGHKPFQKSFAAVNPEQFTVVLLRLRDGSRLPLAGVYRMQGFENFLLKLFGLVGPTIRTKGELSAGDLAVLGARNANRVHAPKLSTVSTQHEDTKSAKDHKEMREG